jgi:hypothetical protein
MPDSADDLIYKYHVSFYGKTVGEESVSFFATEEEFQKILGLFREKPEALRFDKEFVGQRWQVTGKE